jgi:ATP-dependent RNA helicase SUPV3L1/SUV3
LPESVARAVESHRFEPIRVASWRNSSLDFSSIDALVNSLSEAPRRACLRRFDGADDFGALCRLSTRPWLRDACRGEAGVRLLWTVCQVPDYRKLLPEVHAELLAEVFRELASAGRLGDDWLAARAQPLTEVEGDVDALTARIASVRTLTYLCQQAKLVENAKEWQERTHAIEDRLSDALHERLVQRFVERRRRPPQVVRAPFEQALRARLDASVEQDWSTTACAAPFDALTLEPDGRILFQDRELGRLLQGRTLLLPEVRLAPLAANAEHRAALTRRLGEYRRELLALLSRGWYEEDGTPAERGLGYHLLEGLGTVEREGVDALLGELGAEQRSRLEQRGIRLGRKFV